MPLKDTCTRLRNKDLTPSGRPFIPVGHIGLEPDSEYTERFKLDVPRDGSIMWIKSLWVSKPLQADGLGRAALDTLEHMATSPPLSATTLVLDTMEMDDQKKLRPNIKVYTQPWYMRRGYRLIHTAPGVYTTLAEEFEAAGVEPFQVKTVFMRKDL
jgi:hypothetical protein